MLRSALSLAFSAIFIVAPALAGPNDTAASKEYVTGYYKRDGTYVPAQWREKYLKSETRPSVGVPTAYSNTLPQEVVLSPREVQAVDHWSFRHGINDRSEALRQLILRGLNAH